MKTSGKARTSGAQKTGSVIVVLAAAFLIANGAEVRAQGTVASGTQQQPKPTIPITGSKIALAAPVTYDNRYEFYGSINFMNFMAGEHLPKRMNMGGGEFLFTYWLKSNHKFLNNLGPGIEYRGEAGTTPVFPAAEMVIPYNVSRPLVYMNMGLAGAQYRGPKNQYAALNYHGYFGVSHGTFDATIASNQPGQPLWSELTGLYSNRTKPIMALGGSVDFNIKKNWAVRLSPDLILEHFGSEWREFVAVSGGVVYRWGKK